MSRPILGDRYRLVREIGSGGAATVFLAEDQKYHRDVAVKVLRPELATALGGAFFLREIGIVAHLQHPHIVPLYDSGEADGVLYYVMPFVAGESLRARLSRDLRLDETEAVRIAREVALGLDYAHRRAVVHRDIKPDNILLSSGQAMVADFGIARAITLIGSQRLTSTGVFVGTPAYMSPEQATGAEQLDARSDIYSLGCVLFEMVTGQPPFNGSTPQQILAKHAAAVAPSVRTLRPELDPALERTIGRALNKDPDERWQSAEEFATALSAVITPPRLQPADTEDDASTRRSATAMPPSGGATAPVPGPAPSKWRARHFVGVMVALAAIALAYTAIQTLLNDDLLGPLGRGAGRVALDTTRYVLLPIESEVATDSRFDELQLMEDALERWRDITVVDPFQVRDAVARLGNAPMRGEDARAIATMLGAGRYIRGRLTHARDSLRLQAVLYDTRTNMQLSDSVIRYVQGSTVVDSAIQSLADHLLFRDTVAFRRDTHTGTRSLSARQAFVRGQAAIQTWNLAQADSAFSLAARIDPQYAQAALWLSQVRFWNWLPVNTWRFAIDRVATIRSRLPARDQEVADALVAVTQGNLPRACSLWRRMTAQDEFDFAAWYGLATCLRIDDAVMPNPDSPSGWQFRSSYSELSRAYQRAFQLLPSLHTGLVFGSYERVRRLFLTSRNDVRRGRAIDQDTLLFFAYPAWMGDTLVLVPYPERDFTGGSARPIPASLDAAVRRQRTQFYQVALAWSNAFPRSADALEALAVALEMLADPSCLDTLRRARGLATAPSERLHTAASEVWMRLKFARAGDLDAISTAAALADSMLREFPPSTTPLPEASASLAALTGRATLAAAYAALPAVSVARRLPSFLTGIAPTFLTYAALGGPADTVRALEARVLATIERDASPSERRPLRDEWVGRAVALAFPDVPLPVVATLANHGDYLLDAQAALTAHDTTHVRAILRTLQASRTAIPPSDLTFDALFPEASLLTAMGDVNGAIAWLDGPLNALRTTAPQMFATPAQAGPLVRAMALRATLADRAGDRPAARRWAGMVVVLWRDADPFLQPLVDRMRVLAR